MDKDSKIVIIFLSVFMVFVILFSPFFIILKTKPNVNDEVLKLYKDVVENVNKEYKISIDYRNLIAIDAVRYEQDFSKANKHNIKKLAKMFILKEKYEIRYNLSSYQNIVSEVNKKNGTNIDWRDVVRVSTLINGEKQFELIGSNRIKDIANSFIRIKQVPQYYTVTETVTVKENYREWKNWFDSMPWFGGRWITKTKKVKKKVPVQKIKYNTKKETKNINDVLREKGCSSRDIPQKFKDKNKITTNMLNKYEIVYKVKDLDTVLDELKFTEEQKKDVHTFLQFGLSDLGDSNEFGDLEGSGERYTIPRFYQYDKRWAAHPYGESTIGRGGCGTTSFAMVATGMNPKNLKKMDKNKDGILDPIETSDWSASHGFKVPGNGTSWGFFSAASNVIGLNVKQIAKGDYNKVFNYLKDGNPVIASMTPGHFTRGGHFIVLTGVDDKEKIIVNDPGSEARSKQTWDKQIVFNEAAQYWVFSKNMGSGANYEITAYTGDPSENGGSAGRYAADGKTDLWKLDLSNRVIAVDPRKIPLGKKVYIEFPKEIRYVKLKNGKKFNLNGVYTAVDTGGDIKRNRIDLYVGFDGVNVKGYWYKLSNHIGRRKVRVYKDY